MEVPFKGIMPRLDRRDLKELKDLFKKSEGPSVAIRQGVSDSDNNDQNRRYITFSKANQKHFSASLVQKLSLV